MFSSQERDCLSYLVHHLKWVFDCASHGTSAYVEYAHNKRGNKMSISSISSQSSSSYWEKIFGGSNAENSQKTDGDDLAAKLFQDLDSDESGGIGIKESGLSQSQFDALDTDQDGTVSLKELQAGLELQRQAFFTSMKMESGSTSAASTSTTSTGGSEQSHAQSLLSAIMNGEPLPPPPDGAGNKGDLASKLFTDLDTDQSGGISVGESGLNQSVFDSMDTDQDGIVSMEELSASLEKQKATFASGQNTENQSVELNSENSVSSILNAAGNINSQRILNTIANAVYRSMADQGTQSQGLGMTA